MHGLIFVTWEKYLTERFGSALLGAYRKEIGENPFYCTPCQSPVW